MWLFGFLFGLPVGGAAIWFGKDWMIKQVMGAVAFEKMLEAKIAALKAKI